MLSYMVFPQRRICLWHFQAKHDGFKQNHGHKYLLWSVGTKLVGHEAERGHTGCEVVPVGLDEIMTSDGRGVNVMLPEWANQRLRCINQSKSSELDFGEFTTTNTINVFHLGARTKIIHQQILRTTQWRVRLCYPRVAKDHRHPDTDRLPICPVTQEALRSFTDPHFRFTAYASLSRLLQPGFLFPQELNSTKQFSSGPGWKTSVHDAMPSWIQQLILSMVIVSLQLTFPTTGKSTDPQESANQCTSPLRKSAVRIPSTEIRKHFKMQQCTYPSNVKIKTQNITAM